MAEVPLWLLSPDCLDFSFLVSQQNFRIFSLFSHDFGHPGALSFSHNANGSATETFYGGALRADAQTEDEQKIQALVQHLAVAARAKDVSDIMSVYVADESLIVFDVTPPLQYLGAKAYKKDWEDFFAAFPGPVEVELGALSVTTDGTLGFSHEVDTYRVTDQEGKKVTFTFRQTYVYRKVNGKWRIIHDHASVPVDVASGRAELSLKP